MSETTAEATEHGPDETADTVSDTFVDEATVRDRVWDATLSLIATRPLPFQLWRVRKRAGLEQRHERTIRRTLSTMAEAGWLDHSHNSPWWYPGEKAKARIDTEFPV
jgi:hypothetical protein